MESTKKDVFAFVLFRVFVFSCFRDLLLFFSLIHEKLRRVAPFASVGKPKYSDNINWQ